MGGLVNESVSENLFRFKGPELKAVVVLYIDYVLLIKACNILNEYFFRSIVVVSVCLIKLINHLKISYNNKK